MTQWTRDMSAQAEAEGWDIFDADGSMLNKDGDRPFQLQRIDDPQVDEVGYGEPKFTDDAAAHRHVRAKAEMGSALHVAALEYLKAESLPEFADIMALDRLPA